MVQQQQVKILRAGTALRKEIQAQSVKQVDPKQPACNISLIGAADEAQTAARQLQGRFIDIEYRITESSLLAGLVKAVGSCIVTSLFAARTKRSSATAAWVR